MTIEVRHVLMDCGMAQAEARSNLLLAVALQQTRKRLAESGGKSVGARLGGADQRPTDEPTELGVKEVEQTLLTQREVPVAAQPDQRNDTDGAVVGRPEY